MDNTENIVIGDRVKFSEKWMSNYSKKGILFNRANMKRGVYLGPLPYNPELVRVCWDCNTGSSIYHNSFIEKSLSHE